MECISARSLQKCHHFVHFVHFVTETVAPALLTAAQTMVAGGDLRTRKSKRWHTQQKKEIKNKINYKRVVIINKMKGET